MSKEIYNSLYRENLIAVLKEDEETNDFTSFRAKIWREDKQKLSSLRKELDEMKKRS